MTSPGGKRRLETSVYLAFPVINEGVNERVNESKEEEDEEEKVDGGKKKNRRSEMAVSLSIRSPWNQPSMFYFFFDPPSASRVRKDDGRAGQGLGGGGT